MNKLSKIKLTQLCKAELENKQMSRLLGGDCCSCTCWGSSSTGMNNYFNTEAGYSQSGDGNGHCSCCCDDNNINGGAQQARW